MGEEDLSCIVHVRTTGPVTAKKEDLNHRMIYDSLTFAYSGAKSYSVGNVILANIYIDLED